MEMEEKRMEQSLPDKKKLEWWIFRSAVVVFSGVFLYGFFGGSPAVGQAVNVLLYFVILLAGSRGGAGAGALTGMAGGILQAVHTGDLTLLGICCIIGAFAGFFNRLGKFGSMAGGFAAAMGISALSRGGMYEKFVPELMFALAVFAVLPEGLTGRKPRKDVKDMPGATATGDSVSARRLMLLSETLEKLSHTFGYSVHQDMTTACTVPDAVVEEIGWKSRFYESRETIGTQFHEMGEMVAQVAGEISGVEDITETLEQPVKKIFGRQKLQISHLQVLEYANGRLEAYLTLASRKGKYMTARDISELMNKSTGRRWCASADGRSVVAGEPVMIKLEEETGYRILTGIARQMKAGELISGDTFAATSLPMGRMLLCLSDGMGSGENAFAESEMMMDLVEQLLEAGFSTATTVRIVNTALVLCRDEQHPTTLDLCVIDQHTACCEVLKQGACPTFIRRGSQVEVIDMPMLPAGMLSDMAPDPVSCRLQNGDMIVMVTDGVLEGMEGADKEEAFCALLRACPASNPKELSAELLAAALRDGEPKDDMTVLAAAIWEK